LKPQKLKKEYMWPKFGIKVKEGRKKPLSLGRLPGLRRIGNKNLSKRRINNPRMPNWSLNPQ